MLSCFHDPYFIVTSAFSNLYPGGYFEMQDPQMPITCIDDTIKGTSIEEWNNSVCLAAEILGQPLTNSRNYGRWMTQAGFVDVVEKHTYWPLNTWPKGKKEKQLGLWTQQNLLDGLNAMSMAMLTRGLGWSPDRVELLLVGVRDDVKNRKIHAYIDV
jgi:hypothetical protein